MKLKKTFNFKKENKMKKIISILLISMMVMSSIIPANAATYTTGATVGTVVTKTPTNV